MLFDPKNTFDRKRADAYYNKLMSGPDPFEITKKTKKDRYRRILFFTCGYK